MANYYCKHCGISKTSIQSLTSAPCSSHPNGFCKGQHELYEGSEKSEYSCKYCGQTNRALNNLVTVPCARHPYGFCKGNHSAAL